MIVLFVFAILVFVAALVTVFAAKKMNKPLLRKLLPTGLLVTSILLGCFILMRQSVKLPPIQDVKINFQVYKEFWKIKHNRWMCIYCATNFSFYFILQVIIGKKFLEDFCLVSGATAAMSMSVMALLAAGLSFLLLGVAYYFVDCRGYKSQTEWLRVYGMNSIAAYMLTQIFNFRPIAASLLHGWEQYMGDWYACLLTVCHVATIYLILWVMYRKKIFLKA